MYFLVHNQGKSPSLKSKDKVFQKAAINLYLNLRQSGCLNQLAKGLSSDQSDLPLELRSISQIALLQFNGKGME